MGALLLDSPGTPDSLRLAETDLPIPGPGEVRLKAHAVGLHPTADKFMVRGIGAWSHPHIPGLDVAGLIDAVGEGATARRRAMLCSITVTSDGREALPTTR